MENQNTNVKEQERQEGQKLFPAFDPVLIKNLTVQTYKIPTETIESDGTLQWDHTVLVLVKVFAGNSTGVGYTYADISTGLFIQTHLKSVVEGSDSFNIEGVWHNMQRKIRNLGRPGIASMAISAIDIALWDLKSKILNIPLVKLLGQSHSSMDLYASGGFTSYSIQKLKNQLSGWIDNGFKMIKIKVGTNPEMDPKRINAAKSILGDKADLFIDANGAYTLKQALELAEQLSDHKIKWFEEPVSSDNLNGLKLLKDRAPAGMNIAAGEYGYDQFYFLRMLSSGAVDILQADATRCGGITGFLKVANLSDAFNIPISAHTAPAIHLHACCSTENCVHIEYFYDHYRIENMLFEGISKPENGKLSPQLSLAGTGLEFKEQDAKKFIIS